MGFFRRKNQREDGNDLGSLYDEENEISSKIQEIQQFLEEAPRAAKAREEEKRMVMPPPDDLDDRRRESIFFDELSRGEIRNERRSQARYLALFLLLISATVAILMWVVRVVQTAS